MRILVSALVFSVLLTGCVNGKFHKKPSTGGPCGAIDGYTYTLVTYGNGTLVVIPVSRIHAKSEWRFYLYPIDKLGGAPAYGTSAVTIRGKAAGKKVLNSNGTALIPYVLPTPVPLLGNTWLKADGDFDSAEGTGSKRYITACVPPDVQEDQEWHFTVDIADVGEIDPRGRVEK